MGTATNRSSCNDKYYTMGNTIPGILINGMNVLAVKEGFKFVKEHLSSGKGPMYVECDTYRYHGHSMSDPGEILYCRRITLTCLCNFFAHSVKYD
jgi:pyruvate dehydrogenase E1 component alpha subunit